MKYNDLILAPRKAGKRVGRGIAAGQGKTAGRGTKGQMSRTGSSKRPGFEGGQTPLMQRIPKLSGFRSFKVKAEAVYTGQLDAFSGKTVDNASLAAAGLVTNAFVKVKLITKGDITKKVSVSLQGASVSAIAAVEKAGGSFTKVALQARPTSTRTRKEAEARPKKKTTKKEA